VALRARTNRSAFLANDDPVAAYEASRENLALARRLGDRGVSVIIQNLADSGLRTGRWDELLAELGASLDEDLDPSERAWLLGNELAIRSIRGEPITQMHAEVVALLEGITDPAAHAWRAWCDIWEAFPAGRYAEARTRCLDAIRVFAQAADVAGILPARAALWGRDVDGAAADLARLEESGGRGRAARADRLTVRAGIAALGGRRAEALATYREVLRAWRDLGCAWDEALTAIDMALLLDPAEPEVRAASERARDILVGLQARPFLERLEAAMAGVMPAAGARGARAPAERSMSGITAAPER
jgi:tetratricopeptide (TPR) repeat protein